MNLNLKLRNITISINYLSLNGVTHGINLGSKDLSLANVLIALTGKKLVNVFWMNMRSKGRRKTKTRLENFASKPNKPPIFPDTDVLTDNWLIPTMYKKDGNWHDCSDIYVITFLKPTSETMYQSIKKYTWILHVALS